MLDDARSLDVERTDGSERADRDETTSSRSCSSKKILQGRTYALDGVGSSARTLNHMENRWRKAQGTARAFEFSNPRRKERFCLVNPGTFEKATLVRNRQDNVVQPVWRPGAAAAEARSRPDPAAYPFTEFKALELKKIAHNLLSHKDMFREATKYLLELKETRDSNNQQEGVDEEDDEGDFESEDDLDTTSSESSPSPDAPETDELQTDQSTLSLGTQSRALPVSVSREQQLRNECETCKIVLESARQAWVALHAGSGPLVDRGKFARKVLRPLFLDMMRLEALHCHLDVLAEVAATKLGAFVQAYMDLAAIVVGSEARRLRSRRESSLADLRTEHSCKLETAYAALERSGWDRDLASRLLGRRRIPSEASKDGVRAELARNADVRLLEAVRSANAPEVRRALSAGSCSSVRLAWALAARSRAVGAEGVLRELLSVATSAHTRRALLVASSQGVDAAVAWVLQEAAPPLATVLEGLVVAAKRGHVGAVRLLLASARLSGEHAEAEVEAETEAGAEVDVETLISEPSTLSVADTASDTESSFSTENDPSAQAEVAASLQKALMAAVATDRIAVVRILLPAVPRRVWERAALLAQGSRRSRCQRLFTSWQEMGQSRREHLPGPGPGPSPNACADYAHVQELVGELRLAHGVSLSGKRVVDLHCQGGVALLACCMAQHDLAAAHGVEPDVELRKLAQRAADRFAAELPAAEDDDDDDDKDVKDGKDVKDDKDVKGEKDSENEEGHASRSQSDEASAAQPLLRVTTSEEPEEDWQEATDFVFAIPSDFEDAELQRLPAGAVVAVYAPTSALLDRPPEPANGWARLPLRRAPFQAFLALGPCD